jgi:hypothetical protein
MKVISVIILWRVRMSPEGILTITIIIIIATGIPALTIIFTKWLYFVINPVNEEYRIPDIIEDEEDNQLQPAEAAESF